MRIGWRPSSRLKKKLNIGITFQSVAHFLHIQTFSDFKIARPVINSKDSSQEAQQFRGTYLRHPQRQRVS
jgi:hypothetical protein